MNNNSKTWSINVSWFQHCAGSVEAVVVISREAEHVSHMVSDCYRLTQHCWAVIQPKLACIVWSALELSDRLMLSDIERGQETLRQ